ncbi:class I SAM-dependent RNA methyltransferase [Leptospira congkakensis]|uniref:Class I SAM-dependent RNA methyltransferase n=1 Tax=Leptospira congkakensis TaxID=2484932 RepID=A0A4Z1A6T3_9LEPT|nr:methyltransferase domain-containing protein [Leptospira congkakensis]TGL86616.1 class I SAM-dependent RNA methyltransferase [Leptospira congkakensis]TGL93839.1 class I SAM-dependent RNA methyltransferase [Leptospira congkakensis]TGL94755.1 class I SAM-dependent RNA methyltransferase [Leptospira congkakensis]
MEKLRIKLEKWVNGGFCIAHHEGHAVFVEGGIPGELVDISLYKTGNKEWFGSVSEVIEPNESRIPSDCSVFMECGGCSYRHISYRDEIKIKTSLLEGMFPQWKSKIQVITGPENEYRNNVQWQSNGKEIGYFAKNSHRVVNESQSVCKTVDKRLLWDLVPPGIKKSVSKQKSIQLRLSSKSVVNYERDQTEINVFNTKLKVPERGFFQINRFLLEPWLEKIKSLLPDSANILELFCGCGTIGISIREKIESLYGIESHEKSIRYAKENAKTNSALMFEYEVSDLYQKHLPKHTAKFPIWIVNPPRAGLTEGIIESASMFSPKQIVYSSCNPSTLKRDITRLEKIGYRMQYMGLFDFFPRTQHYEVLVSLKK